MYRTCWGKTKTLNPTSLQAIQVTAVQNNGDIWCTVEWTDLELGWAAGLPCSACQSSTPSQDFILVVLETSPSSPSQKTPPSEVSATLVKIVFLEIVSMAIGLVFIEVPESIHKQLGPMYWRSNLLVLHNSFVDFSNCCNLFLTWSHSKESSFWVYGPEFSILIEPHPSNIITNTGNFVVW